MRLKNEKSFNIYPPQNIQSHVANTKPHKKTLPARYIEQTPVNSYNTNYDIC